MTYPFLRNGKQMAFSLSFSSLLTFKKINTFKCFFPFSFWKSCLLQPFLNKNPRLQQESLPLGQPLWMFLRPTQSRKTVRPLNTSSLTFCAGTYPLPAVLPTLTSLKGNYFRHELHTQWWSFFKRLFEKVLEQISDCTRLTYESLSLSYIPVMNMWELEFKKQYYLN